MLYKRNIHCVFFDFVLDAQCRFVTHFLKISTVKLCKMPWTVFIYHFISCAVKREKKLNQYSLLPPFAFSGLAFGFHSFSRYLANTLFQASWRFCHSSSVDLVCLSPDLYDVDVRVDIKDHHGINGFWTKCRQRKWR